MFRLVLIKEKKKWSDNRAVRRGKAQRRRERAMGNPGVAPCPLLQDFPSSVITAVRSYTSI
jgi:hypothetical protein